MVKGYHPKGSSPQRVNPSIYQGFEHNGGGGEWGRGGWGGGGEWGGGVGKWGGGVGKGGGGGGSGVGLGYHISLPRIFATGMMFLQHKYIQTPSQSINVEINLSGKWHAPRYPCVC